MAKSMIIRRVAGIAATALVATGGVATLATTDAHAAGDGKVTSQGSLTVRYAPSRHSSARGSIPGGKIIPLGCKITGTSVEGNRTWYLLPGGGTDEWVSGRYVKELDGAKTPWCFTYSGARAIRTTATVRVRRGPNTADASVGTIAAGTNTKAVCKVRAQSVNGNNIWYLLPGSNWISARYAANTGGTVTWCTR